VRLFFLSLLVWNFWLLLMWVNNFHISPQEVMRTLRYNFPTGKFSLSILLENWTMYVLAGVALLGGLAVVGRIGLKTSELLERGMTPATKEPLVCFGLGIGVVGSFMLALGLVGLLFAPPLMVSVCVLAMIALWEAWHIHRVIKPALSSLITTIRIPLTPLSRVVLVLAGVITVMGLLNIEAGWDALTYHLRIPSFYVYRHKIYDVWHHYCAVFPSHIEMLYMLSMLVQGDMLGRFVNFSLGVMLVLAVRSLARALDVPAGWAILLLVACPTFLNLTTRSYVDLGFTFLCTLSVLAFLRWWRTGSLSALVVSGLLAGWGMSCKYVGVLMLFAMFAAVLPRLKTAVGLRATLLWNVAAFLPLCPWLLKNWLLKANPVSPFLQGVFGTIEAVPHQLLTDFSSAAPLQSFFVSLPVRAEALFMNFGAINGPLIPIVAGLFPLLALKHYQGLQLPLRRAVLGFTLGWFVLCPDVRFFLPILPVLCVLYAGVIKWLVEQGGVLRGGVRTFVEVNVLVGLLYGAGIQWMFYSPLSMPLGFESTATKLKRVLPPPPFTSYLKDYVNEHLPHDARILYLCHFSTYFVERECIADFHFGQAQITRIIRQGRTAEGIHEKLRQLGVRWLLSTGTGAAQYITIPGFFDVPEGGWREMKRLLAERTEVVWQTNEYTLFRLGPPHAPWPLPALPVYEALQFHEADQALANGRVQEALAAYLDVPDLLKDVGSTYVRQGDGFSGLGKFALAVRAYEHSRVLGVDTPRLRSGLALALLSQGLAAEAMPHAQEAWRQDPLSAQTAAILAGVYATMGQLTTARQWIHEAIRMKPDKVEYRDLAKRIGAFKI